MTFCHLQSPKSLNFRRLQVESEGLPFLLSGVTPVVPPKDATYHTIANLFYEELPN